MANFDTTNPIYNAVMRKLEATDPAHADLFNALFGQLLNNDVFANKKVSELKDSISALLATSVNKDITDEVVWNNDNENRKLYLAGNIVMFSCMYGTETGRKKEIATIPQAYRPTSSVVLNCIPGNFEETKKYPISKINHLNGNVEVEVYGVSGVFEGTVFPIRIEGYYFLPENPGLSALWENLLLDDTLTEAGQAADAKAVGNKMNIVTAEIAGLKKNTGLNDTAKTLLINILRNGVYGTDQSSNISALEIALTGNVYAVKNNLSNVTLSNTAASVKEDAAYTTTLQVASAYEIQTVTITMGGVDVTDQYYANGVVSIPVVTGDIVITATAIKVGDNLIKLAECTSGDKLPDGATVTTGTYLATPYIAVQASTTYKHNITAKQADGTSLYNQKMYQYDSTKAYIDVRQINGTGEYASMSAAQTGAGVSYVRILFSATHEKPYFGISGEVE